MTPDWTRVTLENIRQACELYDSGAAIPKRAAKSTFLALNGKTYPAKFIRGLAYCLATGTELDPNRNFSGGTETVKFFESLGLYTRHEPVSALDESAADTTPSPTVSRKPSTSKAHSEPQQRELPSIQLSLEGTNEGIRKIALISHDYNVPGIGAWYDYSEHFSRINHLCDEQGCDTILYSLYTWDKESPVPRNHEAIFRGLTQVQRIFIEVGQPGFDRYDHLEVWQRGEKEPLIATQRFAKSTVSGTDKQKFFDDLPVRMVNDALLVICGETNIASLVRGSEEFYDPYGFNDRLGEMNVRLIFKPVHDYMRRYEMREKRRYYSHGGRTVISVWNQGKGKESHFPWTVFSNGAEGTETVEELARPFADRPDIRIGILDLVKLEVNPEDK